MQLPHKTKQFWSSAIKLLVVSLSFFVIYKALEDINSVQWQLVFGHSYLGQLLCIAFFFSLLNWSLESLKWKTLLKEYSPIQFNRAFSETLRAHAVSIITPNKIGEFGAKASFYPKQLRTLVLKQTLTGQLYQLIVTCLFGILGVVYMFSELSTSLKFSIGIALATILIFSICFIMIKPSIKWLIKFKDYIISLADLSNVIHRKVLLFSVLRYLVFSHQFFLLLYIFQPELSYIQVMPILFVIYLVSSIVPTFLILDATLKTSLSLILLDGIIAPEVILAVNVLMWIFNFGIPAFIGNLLILYPKPISLKPKKVL
ncbi:flippase-like domain-containing protein [Psychroflexus montanilacus]|uniref:flippase-like domain-containing protein n=1 Tax=Psychroflexus montanilacus TaxID=2873598 RepID=UPI001CD0041A|nr:flippase-like domain-containing protein [Psychroflexus montanilacus]MBZ9651408.1 flippase-like domain-containing protein [Psychroflexus montanilacus]